MSLKSKDFLLTYITVYSAGLKYLNENSVQHSSIQHSSGQLLIPSASKGIVITYGGWWSDWGQCVAGILGGAITTGTTLALAGAAVGTVTVPGVGTVSGAAVGAIGGAIGGAISGAAAAC